MIHFVLLISRQGKVRLTKWYSPYSQKERTKVIRELSGMILTRAPKLCNFVEWRGFKVVYKRYASLYFCMCIDQDDNELEVLEIIHHFVEILDRYFGSVCELDLIFNFHKDKPERAIRVWARMKYKNPKPDIRTFELLFSLFGSVNAPYDDPNLVSQADAAKRIKAIEMDMTRHGIQNNLFSLQNLLKALGREKMVNELIQYIRVAEEQCVYRNTNLGVQIYNTFLHSLVEAKESYMAIEIFKKMISCGLSPNLSTYAIMIDCCSIINCYTSACALISRMIRDGLPMNVVIYTGLVKIVSRSEAFNEAFRLLDLAISEAIQPDLLLYNAILKIASQKGKIGVLELIVEKMHWLKIRPDPSTCRHGFSAYADNGFHSTAMEALQVMSLRMISEEDDILKEYRLKYDNLILDEESDPESEIVGVFKDSPDLVVSLLNLRWYAILVSPPSWLPDQSPWAKRLSSNYTARVSG